MTSYAIFHAGIILVGIGSAYYHLQPNNNTLVWDRLPMAIAFMAFFNLIIGSYISQKVARLLLGPLLAIGVLSVLYWHYTEQAGAGDLRFYILVQFLPLLLIPFIISMFNSRYLHSQYIWLILGCYLLAKLFESMDAVCFMRSGFISGHSIKHLLAALGPLLTLFAFKKDPT